MKTDQFINLIVALNSSVCAENYDECMWVDQSYRVVIMYNCLLHSREILACRKETQSDEVNDVKTLHYQHLLDYQHLFREFQLPTLEEGHVFSIL